MNKKNIIICCIAFTVVLCIIVAFFIFRSYDDKNEEINIVEKNKVNVVSSTFNNINEIRNEEIVETVSTEEKKTLETTKIRLTTYYKDCGHTVIEEYLVPEVVIGMTRSEVEKYYTDWNLVKWSQEQIELSKQEDGICDEHYLVKAENGLLVAYTEYNGVRKLFRKTEITTKYLSDEDKEKLEQGINIVGKKDLNRFFEDYE